MPDPLPTAGSLREVGYPELLRRLHGEGASGALHISHEDGSKIVYFREGRLVFSRSTDPNDRLGEFLLREGRVNLSQYLESAARIEPGRRQGAVLCEMGAVSPEDLLQLVQEQVCEIVSSLFLWSDGRFEIDYEDEGQGESIVLSIPIDEVILRGIRRVPDWDRIWRGIGGSIDAVFARTRRAETISYHSSLSQDEAHVLSLVDGRLDVGRILGLSYAPNFETCRMLWSLKLLDAIESVELGTRPAAPAEDYALAEAIEAYDRVFTIIHGFVAERIEELVDHFMDRVMEEVAARRPEVLRDVHLRNQGRVEYEHVFNNLSSHPEDDRRGRAAAALNDLLVTLVDTTTRELGEEECSQLREILLTAADEVPDVPLAQLLSGERDTEERDPAYP